MKNNFKKIFPIIFFFMLCVLFLFLLNIINNNEKVYTRNEISWKKEADRRSEIRLLNNSFFKIQKDKDLLNAHFIESSNVVPLLDALEKIAEKIDASSQVESVDVSDDGKEFYVELSVKGGFEEISKYVLLLESFPFELDFVSFDISKNSSVEKSKKEGVWNANFKLKLLSFIPE